MLQHLEVSMVVFISTEPPNRVLASFSHGSDLLLAGQVYVLECLIEEIAPVKHLILTFYKGQEVLGHMYFNSSQDVKPVTKTSNYTIIAVEEDDGAQYWCDARLNLHVQQDPVTVSSQKRHATVHCTYHVLANFCHFYS